ncbi:MAG: UDP-N-acetylglucosamine 2-epimerase (non-hydrolyzing), partial [Deltaproteobacteria bacterium]|nr:UDP-N-acetylglucosamine 2-epimerase (non-hydrolyzing) [Deltaproteobacteria bacterium]MBM4317978.1 UDP-N-acetylglucosamine 2-epimerase (non-hydrolyzing) [Deltaproteobacteria bacterium]
MNTPHKILLIFGTRPEAIKMAPVFLALKEKSDLFEVKVCVTGQHRQMLDQVMSLFEMKPDYDLNIMTEGQDVTDITSKVLLKLRDVFKKENPNRVLVHGDTTTTLAASLAAFYAKIPVGHVEAGLRTGNLFAPWPEEMNRNVTTVLADLHFAPTESAKRNLLKESISASQIFVTGNTVIDALYMVVKRTQVASPLKKSLEECFSALHPDKKLILVTGHRRENFGQGFDNFCRAILTVLKENPDAEVCYPVHLNPNVKEPVNRILKTADETVSSRLHLIDPLEYVPFVYLMNRSYFILTDSGGIQEEGPALGKPILVSRDVTERPEALEGDAVKLVGTDFNKIVQECNLLLRNEYEYNRRRKKTSPYGDGNAADRILKILAAEALASSIEAA